MSDFSLIFELMFWPVLVLGVLLGSGVAVLLCLFNLSSVTDGGIR